VTDTDEQQQTTCGHSWCLAHRCTPHGCTRASTDLDHVDGDPQNNDPSNHRAMCASCHSSKTARHDGSFGRPRSRDSIQEATYAVLRRSEHALVRNAVGSVRRLDY
jgi:hypothetical protein